MKHVLITGGAGFIGFHLASKLVENDCKITLVDNLSRGTKDSDLESLLENPLVSLLTADLSNPESAKELPKDVDMIFHFAAIVGVQNVSKQPYKVLTLNVSLLDSMIQYAQSLKSLNRFVFTSTSEVYAGTLTHYGLEFPTPETTPLAVADLNAPRTSYMLSKIYGEAMCLQAELPVMIFRPHNIYGPRMGMSHVIPQLLEKAESANEGESIEVYSPTHKRTFCFIEDAVQVMVQAVQHAGVEAQTLNLGTQEPEVTMRELAEMIISTVGKDLSIAELPATAGSPERRMPMNKLASEVSGHASQVSLQDGIKRTYEWYKKASFF